MDFKPHEYQAHAIRHVIDHPHAGLFLDMGLGKTVITLTAIDELMYERFEVGKVLIIAPRRVAETVWTDEAAKWSHLRRLRLSVAVGTERERKAALAKDADVYVINRENVAWLVALHGGGFAYDMVVIDELSSFKSSKSIRFKALRLVRPRVRRVLGLTGTPSPNGLIDLWAQLYLLDMGARLGKTITGYRERYFVPGRRNAQVVFDYRLRPGCEDKIRQAIGDICISMRSADYLELPECVYRTVKVRLSEAERARYTQFERELVLSLTEGAEDISAVNAAALSTKLRQYANGAVYDDAGGVQHIHDAKLEALEEILEELQGRGALVLYAFKHDATRIEAKSARFSPRRIGDTDTVRKWNSGQIKCLIGHPASMGHGLNLQGGGDAVIWFGPTWSLELWLQANARLLRQGRERPVTVIAIVTENTIDERMLDAIEMKRGGQEALMEAVRAIVRGVKAR
jgi:SNF2 family DNA or RNA helicase